ncbi:MAG TPA: hypothetical protein VF640_03515 [Acidimicrobiales bacterium]|jgi:hypothetical protein
MNARRLFGAATLVALAVAGCGEGAVVDAGGGDVAASVADGPVSLVDVAASCARPTAAGPGIAIVTTELRDANRTVSLPDCVVHLEQGADVTLNNVTITGGILNIHDRATDASSNRLRLQRVSVDNDALLVELNDADDTFDAEATSIRTRRGIGVRVAGTRDGANEGGTISMVTSSLLATDADATVHVLASEHSGVVRLVDTSIDTRGPLTVLAGTCTARLRGRTLACSTEAVAEELAG